MVPENEPILNSPQYEIQQYYRAVFSDYRWKIVGAHPHGDLKRPKPEPLTPSRASGPLAAFEIEEIGADTIAFFREQREALNNADLDLQLGSMLIGPIKSPYWVAEITGTDPKYGYARTFLRARRDYSRSNSIGSRGIYLCYILEAGKLYQAQSKPSWSRLERYFLTATTDGRIEYLSDEEAAEWLKSHSASTS